MKLINLAGIFAVMLVFNLYFFMKSMRPVLTGNESAYSMLVAAITSEGSFALSGKMSLGDTATHDGKFYSNKPPGFPFLMTPPFYLVSKLFSFDVMGNSGISSAFFFLKVGNVLISTLAMIFVFLLLRELDLSLGSVFFGVAAAAFGTFFSVYSCLATSIPTSIMLTVLALFAYVKFLKMPDRPAFWALSVLAASYAVIVDYANGFSLLPLFVLLTLQIKNHLKLVAYATVGLIPLGLILFYNYKAFGNPFTLSYSHYVPPSYVPWEDVSHSMAVANIPRGFYGLMISPSRGMLLLSPVTILGILAALTIFKQKQYHRYAIVAVALSGIVIVSAYSLWHGGHCLGYRHALIGAVLLASLSSVFVHSAKGWQRWLAIAVLVYSCFITLMAFHIQLEPELLGLSWKAEPDDVQANFFSELLLPFLNR